MTHAAAQSWETKRTPESQQIEDVLTKAGFEKAQAYRYNSASIRVRVIDPRFKGRSVEERDAMVEPYLKELPERTQADIINLLTVTPEEVDMPDISFRSYLLNAEFEDPGPSML